MEKIRQEGRASLHYTIAFVRWMLTAVFIGMLCGAVGALFAMAVEWATETRTTHGWLLFLLPLGGLGEETGGYKGYGFTTIVEILSAALAGGPFLKELSGKDENGNNRMYRLGHFFFVINPEFFMGLETFRRTAGGICRGLRDSEKAPGAQRIYTAGEKEYLAWQDQKEKGVPVGEAIQKEFIALRDECGLDYHFPFED